MDSSIRPIQSQPTTPATPVHRRREGEPTFDLPDDDAERDADDKNADSNDDTHREPDAQRPVAPPPDDEAGSHLDITA